MTLQNRASHYMHPPTSQASKLMHLSVHVYTQDGNDNSRLTPAGVIAVAHAPAAAEIRPRSSHTHKPALHSVQKPAALCA